jgi:hypothetical protein
MLNPRVRRVVDSLPLWVITISHVWRFVGIGFVIGAMVNVLPVQFGYPEGLGDVAAAALCLPLAFAIHKSAFSPRLRVAFIAWNLFGLIDLISAITMGVLYSQSSFGVLRTGVSTRLMTTFDQHDSDLLRAPVHPAARAGVETEQGGCGVAGNNRETTGTRKRRMPTVKT